MTAFAAEVEPRLVAFPRVHRFAAAPVLGGAEVAATALAVCISGTAGGATVTRASLDGQTLAPAAVTEGTVEEALAASRAPWMVVVEAGVALEPRALERIGQAATLAPDAALITCDEDSLDRRGRRTDPVCRPGPSPDLALAVGFKHAVLAVAAGPARAAAADAASRDELALELAGPDAGGHAHVPEMLAHRTRAAARSVRQPGDTAGIARVLARRGEGSASVEQTRAGGVRVRRSVRGEPRVAVIVCFRDRAGLLERCVRSVLDRSSYENLSVALVDNGSERPETAAVVSSLTTSDDRVTNVRDPRPFNFSALNNAVARGTSADALVFLNNDTEVVTPTWLEDLLEEAQRPEVGAVAPLLLYADGRVQHAGAAVGIHGAAGHPFAGRRPDERTPFGAASDGTRNWLAVTAACTMVERAKFDAVGGFDERFVIGGGDVDLGLRLSAAGHRSLCVPHTRLVHHESRSRGSRVGPDDLAHSRASYGKFLSVGDPFYNPNLTLADTSCRLRRPDEVRAG